LRNPTAPHLNAFFDIIDRGLNGPNAARDAETSMLLDQWLLRPRRDPYVDLTSKVTVCGTQACQPIPVPMRVPTDFMGHGARSSLPEAGRESLRLRESTTYCVLDGALLTEWARPSRLQSAAAGSLVVAPESIASLFGSNLASQTAQASAQPLPATLENLGIKDARGGQPVRGAADLCFARTCIVNVATPGATPGRQLYDHVPANIDQRRRGLVARDP